MTSRRLCAAVVLAFGLCAVTLAQEGFPLFTTDFPPEEFRARWDRVTGRSFGAATSESVIMTVDG